MQIDKDPTGPRGFPARLRRARLDRGWSQRELARRIHTSYATIQNYEGEHGNPTMWNLVELAHVLECSLDELLGINYGAPKQ